MRDREIFLAFFLYLFGLAACGPAGTATPAGTIEIIATRTPPLAIVPFPTQTITYATDWPSDLMFPPSFDVIEANSGILPDGTSRGWIVKLRYKGEPSKGATDLSNFFATRNWTVKQSNLAGGVVLVIIERNNKQETGSAILQPDEEHSGYTKILVTVRR